MVVRWVVAAACIAAAVWLFAARDDQAAVQSAVEANAAGRPHEALRATSPAPGGTAEGRGLIERGYALAALRRYREAEVAYRGALELRPNDWRAHRDLSVVLLHLGRAADARRHAERARALNPRM